jgi:hypothetical protein
MRVDPVGLRLGYPFYTDPVQWLGGDIYNLGHGALGCCKVGFSLFSNDSIYFFMFISHNILCKSIQDFRLALGSGSFFIIFSPPKEKTEMKVRVKLSKRLQVIGGNLHAVN